MAGDPPKIPKREDAPKAIPPVRQTDSILLSVSRQARKRESQKKGFASTIFAGENQLKPGSSGFGKRTLLGIT